MSTLFFHRHEQQQLLKWWHPTVKKRTHTPLIPPAASKPNVSCPLCFFFPVCVLAVKIFQLGLFIAPAWRKEYLEISINPHTHHDIRELAMCILQDFKRLFFTTLTCQASVLHLCVFTLLFKWCLGNTLPAQILIIPITLTYLELDFFFIIILGRCAPARTWWW